MKKKVLMVEDNDSILEAVSLILEDAGFEIKPLSHAQDTYDVIDSYKPDIILLDVLMSGIDGREICGKLKNNSKWKHIPLIMVSAHPSAKNTVIDCGADDFLEKPFEADELIDLIKKYTKT